MISTPIPWLDLLSRRFRDVGTEYGPNSQAVVSAFAVLRETRWLDHVGEPLDGSRVTIVQSWSDALTIFDDETCTKYNVNGHLQAPCSRNEAVLARSTERDVWWEKARQEAKRYTALSGIPDSLPQERQDLLFEHLYEFVSMLLVEIIASPEADCTYFREQLAWFYAGRLPCGWDGDWPVGRIRVY